MRWVGDKQQEQFPLLWFQLCQSVGEHLVPLGVQQRVADAVIGGFQPIHGVGIDW